MNKHAPPPFKEQVAFHEKECIPELSASETSPHREVFSFVGAIFKAKDSIFLNGKELGVQALMKSNCTCAISQSNKRYLETFELLTDYVEPNNLLFRSLGFSETECKQMVYAKKLEMLPLDFVITGYDETGDGAELSKPKVVCALKNGMQISNEEAIMVLADWLFDNDYCIGSYDQMMDCESIEEAIAFADVSEEAKRYSSGFNPDNPWEELECATLYDLAAMYVEKVGLLSNVIYSLLHKKYEEAGIILVNTTLSFGFDEELDLCLGGEIGVPDTSLLVSEESFEIDGVFEGIDKVPIIKFLEAEACDGEEMESSIPSQVMIEVSDAYIYLAKALCDEQAFETHM